jgi:predicted nucleotidyltransferase
MVLVQNSEAEKITQALNKNYQPERIVLFGSVARGEEKPNSDLDLFIVKDTHKNYFDRLSEARKFIKTNNQVDLVVYTPRELNKAIAEKRIFINQVLRYGKTLYDANHV